MPGLPGGTVTFLFTDIEGSTRLWEQHPEAMRLALARHDGLMRSAIQAHDGHIFKTIGDAFCAAFYTAPQALAAALDAQLALSSEPWPNDVSIRVRMALHTGTAEGRDNDYFGQPLNRVARLLSAGHGGQVLLSRATQELTRDILPSGANLLSLGEHRLRDLNRAETVFQLQHPDLPSQLPALKSLDNPQLPNNLPRQLTSFIGREKEIAEIKNLLAKTSLLTLTGAGGCGKTRLSLQVAADVLEQYPDGVWLTELAPLFDASLVPQEVASALGVREQPSKTFVQTLTDHLKSRRLLLVLDNCEHLLADCAQLCNSLLRACPQLTILATSREALGIAGEQTYRIPSLSLPDPRQTLSVEQINQYEAVRLFIERAVSSKADFAVTNLTAPTLATLCHRLDGIPLAIELAAARVRSLSVEEIDRRLDNRFRLLTGGNKVAMPRQQTLRALIDWSYDLLKAEEKLLLCRLSVFAGGWTLSAAETVCTGESEAGTAIEDWEMLDLLTGLVDKNLVVVNTQATVTRYRLLETVRQYALERLETGGEAEAVRVRHRDYFLTLAEEAEPKLKGAEQAHWFAVLEAEHDNLRQAMACCMEKTERVEAGLRLGAVLWMFWYVRGHFVEGRAYLVAALRRAEGLQNQRVRADALSVAGDLAFRQSDYAEAWALLEQGLALCRELGDKRGIGFSLNSLGHMSLYQGDYATARELFTESLALFRELGDKPDIAASFNNLGSMATNQGNYAEARALLEQSLALFRESGDQVGIALSLNNLGRVARDEGNYAEARVLLEQSLALSRDLGYKQTIAYALNNLGRIARDEGNYAEARRLSEESLALRRELGDKWGITYALNNLGLVARDEGDYATARALYEESLALRWDLKFKQGIAESLDALAQLAYQQHQRKRAVRLWGAATDLREQIGTPRPPSDQVEFNRQTEQSRTNLGEVAYTAAFKEGRAMTIEQAIVYALEKSE